MKPQKTIPAEGWKGLKDHWRADLLASVMVTLVALPLALGVAIASGAPPIAGVISAICGGVVTGLYRGGYVSIYGPGAGMIVVMLATIQAAGGYAEGSFSRALAVFVVAGALQIGMGLLKMGKFGNLFPSAVINGMLAAIGIIIISKQAHVTLGTIPEASSPFENLLQIPFSLVSLNPAVTLISLVSILALIIFPRVENRWVKSVPPQMWALVFVVPLVHWLGFFETKQITWQSLEFSIGPEFLVDIPKKFVEDFAFPDFSWAGQLDFWLMVISVTLIGAIESIIISKAVDKMDVHHRKTNLNKELIGVGLGTFVSGMIGGLPLITVIARSSVNVSNGAQTRWSNFFHGVLLLLIMLFLGGIIRQVPLAALATILVFVGFKLASPNVFKENYLKGKEQLLVFLTTIFITLFIGLLEGIFAGVALNYLVHIVYSRMPIGSFLQRSFSPKLKVLEEEEHVVVQARGVLHFFNLAKLKSKLEQVPKEAKILVNLSHTRLVDASTLEYLHDLESGKEGGKQLEIIGLAAHHHTSSYPYSLHYKTTTKAKPSKQRKLTSRQQKLGVIATEKGWVFHPEMRWDFDDLAMLPYFEPRSIEHYNNKLEGSFYDGKVEWKIQDITFDEGAITTREVFHISGLSLKFPFDVPEFVMEKTSIFKGILPEGKGGNLSWQKSYHSQLQSLVLAYPHFLSPVVSEFLQNHPGYHLEGQGKHIFIFKQRRFATSDEILKLAYFGQQLTQLILAGHSDKP